MLPDGPPPLLLLSNAALPLASLLVAPAALLPQPLPAVPASPLLPQPLQLAAAAGAAAAAQGLELAAPPPLLLLLPPPLRGRTTVAATRKVLSPPPAAECATTSGSSTLQEAKDETWTAHHAEARAGLPAWSDRPESEAPVLSWWPRNLWFHAPVIVGRAASACRLRMRLAANSTKNLSTHPGADGCCGQWKCQVSRSPQSCSDSAFGRQERPHTRSFATTCMPHD